ncbi:hypothetical protein O3P69_001603 [Scylla paramamosain]|uniref:Uncharacterized protein n=1 Tax=Scylla paramamosain TaxID=85552 RepID=A0AAW0V2L5_SCYPA
MYYSHNRKHETPLTLLDSSTGGHGHSHLARDHYTAKKEHVAILSKQQRGVYVVPARTKAREGRPKSRHVAGLNFQTPLPASPRNKPPRRHFSRA